MKTAVFFRNLWLVAFIGSVCWASPGPIGVALMEQLDLLPVLKDGVRCEQFSSRSRQGGNEKDDSGTTLYQSGSEYVLFESSRPGCIYRFWITYVYYSPWVLRFYFDGETTPRINMPVSDFFSGTIHPFLPPLVRSFWSSAGGYVSYVPIPFRRSLKITISPYSEDQLFWFNITYHTYDNDDGVVTWTGNENLQNVIALWNNAGQDPKPTAGNITRSNTLNLQTAHTWREPAAVAEFEAADNVGRCFPAGRGCSAE